MFLLLFNTIEPEFFKVEGGTNISLETHSPPPIVFWTLNFTVLKIRFSNPIFQNKKEGCWLQKPFEMTHAT